MALPPFFRGFGFNSICELKKIRIECHKEMVENKSE